MQNITVQFQLFSCFLFLVFELTPEACFLLFFIFPSKVVENNEEETVREQYKGKNHFCNRVLIFLLKPG